MVHYSRVAQGLANYIDAELIAPFNGSAKAWGLGIAAGIALKRIDGIFQRYKENEWVTALGLIDGEMIDVEAVYAEALRMAQRNSMTIEIPVLGAVTFKASDVESLYRHIQGV